MHRCYASSQIWACLCQDIYVFTTSSLLMETPHGQYTTHCMVVQHVFSQQRSLGGTSEQIGAGTAASSGAGSRVRSGASSRACWGAGAAAGSGGGC